MKETNRRLKTSYRLRYLSSFFWSIKDLLTDFTVMSYSFMLCFIRRNIFTQMTRWMLDVLEIFLNYHGHIYLRPRWLYARQLKTGEPSDFCYSPIMHRRSVIPCVMSRFFLLQMCPYQLIACPHKCIL